MKWGESMNVFEPHRGIQLDDHILSDQADCYSRQGDGGTIFARFGSNTCFWSNFIIVLHVFRREIKKHLNTIKKKNKYIYIYICIFFYIYITSLSIDRMERPAFSLSLSLSIYIYIHTYIEYINIHIWPSWILST